MSLVDGVVNVKSTVMGETDSGLDIVGAGSLNFPIFNTSNREVLVLIRLVLQYLILLGINIH